MSFPASLALHGGLIKSGDGVGSVDSSLAQLHSIIVKPAHSTIRRLDIFHHVAGYGSVDDLALFCSGSGLFLNWLDSLFGFLFPLRREGVDMVSVRIPARTPREKAGKQQDDYSADDCG